MLLKMQIIRGCSFLFQLIKRNESKNNFVKTKLQRSQVTGHRNGRMPAVLTGRCAISAAAFVNSQQILKQVQDDPLREGPPLPSILERRSSLIFHGPGAIHQFGHLYARYGIGLVHPAFAR
jgi:hypothetical protein